MLVLAYAVVVLHAAAILFMLTGGLLALRWPRTIWFHIPITLAIAGLYVTGSDCPLTNLERWLRARAGAPGYDDGGFIGHYTLAPFGIDVHTTSAQVLIYTIALVPNLIAYSILTARGLRRLRPRLRR